MAASQSLVPVKTLIETGIRKAFSDESQLDLDKCLALLKDTLDLTVSVGARFLPDLPDTSWRLNTGNVPSNARELLKPNRFEILYRNGQQFIAPYTYADYSWNIRGRDNDLVAYRIMEG